METAGVAVFGGSVGFHLLSLGGLAEVALPNPDYPLQPIVGFMLATFGLFFAFVGVRGATNDGPLAVRQATSGLALAVGGVLATAGVLTIVTAGSYVFLYLPWYVQVAVIGFILCLLMFVRMVRVPGSTSTRLVRCPRQVYV